MSTRYNSFRFTSVIAQQKKGKTPYLWRGRKVWISSILHIALVRVMFHSTFDSKDSHKNDPRYEYCRVKFIRRCLLNSFVRPLLYETFLFPFFPSVVVHVYFCYVADYWNESDAVSVFLVSLYRCNITIGVVISSSYWLSTSQSLTVIANHFTVSYRARVCIWTERIYVPPSPKGLKQFRPCIDSSVNNKSMMKTEVFINCQTVNQRRDTG